MNLYLNRSKITPYATYGQMVDDTGVVYIPATLEPPDSVAPGGPIHFVKGPSDEFGEDFKANNVPDRHGGFHFLIAVHWGNYGGVFKPEGCSDTKDCILAGMEHGLLFDHCTKQDELCVLDSVTAFKQFMYKMRYVDSFDLWYNDPPSESVA